MIVDGADAAADRAASSAADRDVSPPAPEPRSTPTKFTELAGAFLVAGVFFIELITSSAL